MILKLISSKHLDTERKIYTRVDFFIGRDAVGADDGLEGAGELVDPEVRRQVGTGYAVNQRWRQYPLVNLTQQTEPLDRHIISRCSEAQWRRNGEQVKCCDVCDVMSYGGLLDDALHGAELVDGQPALGDVVLTVAVEHVHRVVDGFDFQYLNAPNNRTQSCTG